MIYTIGYAGTIVERLIDVLKQKKVSILIDVRSIPKSKYFYLFNDVNLSKQLSKAQIKYENWRIEFGARQENLDFFTDDVLDYEKFAKSERFQNGLKQVNELIKSGENICLMCAEIDPINCHRAVLCAREIAKIENQIEHIILKRNGENIFETQSEFEERLKSSLKVESVDEAYQKQNKKIGYKLTTNN